MPNDKAPLVPGLAAWQTLCTYMHCLRVHELCCLSHVQHIRGWHHLDENIMF